MLAPLAWTAAVILFRKSSAASGFAINFFKNALAVVLLSLTMLGAGIAVPADRSLTDWVRLIASGVLGLAVADTLIFEGLRRIGAARLAIVDTAYAPFVVMLSLAVLGERPDILFMLGAATVVLGVVLANWPEAKLVGHTKADPLGLVLCLLGVAGTAVGVVIAKPVLEHSSLIEVTWTRLVAGLAVQLLWVGARREWSGVLVVLRPSPLWKTLLPGAFIGTYISLLLWLGGFKWADASVAAVLNQMATVYMLVAARIFLGESLRPRQVVGGVLAAAGAIWVAIVPRL